MEVTPDYHSLGKFLIKIDGPSRQHRHKVTTSCVRALLERMVNPPMLDGHEVTPADVDAAESTLTSLIRVAALTMRDRIEGVETGKTLGDPAWQDSTLPISAMKSDIIAPEVRLRALRDVMTFLFSLDEVAADYPESVYALHESADRLMRSIARVRIELQRGGI